MTDLNHQEKHTLYIALKDFLERTPISDKWFYDNLLKKLKDEV
jgi:hypothetical protein